MSIKNINELDLKLILQKGQTIDVDGVKVRPYTVGEIIEFGYSEYMKNIQWASLTVDDFLESVTEPDKKAILIEQAEKLKTLDFYLKLGGQEMAHGLLKSLSMLLRTDDVRIFQDNIIAVGFKDMGIYKVDEDGEEYVDSDVLENISEDDLQLIHRDNFDEIINTVKLQNYLKKPSEVKEKVYADEKTRKLAEQMAKNREKVEKIKKHKEGSNDDEGIDLYDIISSVSSKSYSINELNIWELTLYQLYQKYHRLELLDNYDFSVKAMMAGAEEIDLKHWSSKLE